MQAPWSHIPAKPAKEGSSPMACFCLPSKHFSLPPRRSFSCSSVCMVNNSDLSAFQKVLARTKPVSPLRCPELPAVCR